MEQMKQWWMIAFWMIHLIVSMPMLHASAFRYIDSSVEIIDEAVVIRWSTSAPTNASFGYGKTYETGINQYERFDEYTEEHEVVLTGLDPFKRYSYSVSSFSEGENFIRNSFVGSFYAPSLHPPAMPRNLHYEDISQDTVWLVWEMPDEHTAHEYIIYRNGDEIAKTDRLRYRDDGLESLSAYHYQVASKDITGRLSDLSYALIATTEPPDLTPPTIENVRLVGLGRESAVLVWNTDKEASARVHYGENRLDLSRSSSGWRYNHSVALAGLDEGRQYVYLVESCDRRGNCANSTQHSFIAGGKYDPPILEVPLPEVYNSNRLPIQGITDPLAFVAVYVNPESSDFDVLIPQRYIQANMEGAFTTSVTLDATREMNDLVIRATDLSGNVYDKRHTVRVDTTKPAVAFTRVPALSNESTLFIEGNISKDVQMLVYVKHPSKTADPPGVTIEATSVGAENVQLHWESLPPQQNISHYRIFRNGRHVGVAGDGSFADCTFANTQYTYQVAAVNDACVQGPLSNTVSVETLPGGNCTTPQPMVDACHSRPPTLNVSLFEGSFRQQVRLEPGRNEILMHFVDDANNSIEEFWPVIYDEKPPTIMWTNIRDLSPADDYYVTVRGQIDEPAFVAIQVNENYMYEGRTDEDGHFAIEIELEKLNYRRILEEMRLQDRHRQSSVTGRAITGWATIDDLDGGQDLSNWYGYQTGDDDLMMARLTMDVEDGRFENLINVTATDMVGRVGRSEIDWITYQMCSISTLSSGWVISLTDPQPGILLPRHLLTGVAQITLNYELEWIGGDIFGTEPPVPRVSAYLRDVSRADEELWDHRWFGQPRIYHMPNTNNTKGYIVIQSRALNRLATDSNAYRRELQRAIDRDDLENFDTLYDMETNIANHRMNFSDPLRGGCVFSGFGCVKLPLAFEVRYNDPVYDSRNQDPIVFDGGRRTSGQALQRQCVDLDIGISKRVDPNVIPENFLLSAIRFLNSTLELIDTVLEPINTIKEYTMYACLSSWVVLYVAGVKKAYTCEFSGRVKSIFGSGFRSEVAEAGLCSFVYEDDSDQVRACESCTDSIRAYNRMEDLMKNICDRMACPTAPSFITYVQEVNTIPPQQVTVPLRGDGGPITGEADGRADAQFRFSVGSDCYGVDPTNPEVLMEQYRIWDSYKRGQDYTFKNPVIEYPRVAGEGDSFSLGGQNKEVTCFEPHSYNPLCCVVEYMRQFDSVCGLGSVDGSGFHGIFFDEMQESVCTAFSNVHQDTLGQRVNYSEQSQPFTAANPTSGVSYSDGSEEGGTIFNDAHFDIESVGDVDFNRLCSGGFRRVFNAMAGICERNAQGAPQIIRAPFNYQGPATTGGITSRSGLRDREQAPGASILQGDLRLTEHPPDDPSRIIDGSFTIPPGGDPAALLALTDDHSIYYLVQPRVQSNWFGGSSLSTDEYTVYRGIVTKSYVVANVQSTPIRLGSEGYVQLTSSTVFMPLTEIDVNIFKNQGQIGEINEANYEEFKRDAERFAAARPLHNPQVLSVYNRIRTAIGMQDKQIIVDPTSSFLRSIQCLCLPGITSFLKLWRAILTAVKACLETILLTGDGNPGICREVLSVYICDLIFDVISCFVNRYSAGLERESSINFPGNVIGALSAAGRDVQQSVAGRYGRTGFFQAMFGERQLMHAVCLWAFTGTFDFDFKALTEGEFAEVPVQSQAMLTKCERRFMSYEAHSGRATFNYQFALGMVAGARVDYRLILKCSDDFSCGEFGEGAGQCDCVDQGSSTRNVHIPGAPTSLNRFDVLEETFSQSISANVRYDKAILRYWYINHENQRQEEEVTCSFRTVGGNPPGFCQFYPARGEYLCSVDIGQESFAQITSVRTEREQYRLGEAVKVEVNVRQQLPENMRCFSIDSCPHAKYLKLELSHNGRALIDPDDYFMPVLYDGIISYAFPPEGVRITPDMLSNIPAQNRLACQPETGQRFVSSCSGQFQRSADSITLTARDDGDNRLSFATSTTPNRLCIDNELKDAATGDGTCTIASGNTRTCYCQRDEGPLPISIQTRVGENIIEPGATATIRPQAGWMQEAGTTPGICADGRDVTLQGRITVYDAKSYGHDTYGPSEQPHSYGGQPAYQTFDVRIVCSESGSGDGTGGSGAQATSLPQFGDFVSVSDPLSVDGEGKLSLPYTQDFSSIHASVWNATMPRRTIEGTRDGASYTFNLESLDQGTYNIQFTIQTLPPSRHLQSSVFTVTR